MIDGEVLAKSRIEEKAPAPTRIDVSASVIAEMILPGFRIDYAEIVTLNCRKGTVELRVFSRGLPTGRKVSVTHCLMHDSGPKTFIANIEVIPEPEAAPDRDR